MNPVAARIGPKMRLSDRTICMAAKQGEDDQYYHYEVHNLYGYTESAVTQRFVGSLMEFQFHRRTKFQVPSCDFFFGFIPAPHDK